MSDQCCVREAIVSGLKFERKRVVLCWTCNYQVDILKHNGGISITRQPIMHDDEIEVFIFWIFSFLFSIIDSFLVS